MELFGKVESFQDIINGMLSKQEKHLMVLPRLVNWKIMLYKRGGEKNTHT
jgi:hypothetical protein